LLQIDRLIPRLVSAKNRAKSHEEIHGKFLDHRLFTVAATKKRPNYRIAVAGIGDLRMKVIRR
jgi:hypothetical protein